MTGWVMEVEGWTQASAVMVGLGLWIMVGVTLWQGGRAAWTEWLARLGFVLAAGVSGAFLWGYFLGSGGFSSMGALLGAGLVMGLEPMIDGEEGWARLDLLVPAGLLGGGVARLGCLLQGCDIGTRTGGGWGVVYGAGTRAWETHWAHYGLGFHEPYSLVVHPFGLYLGGLAIAIASVGFMLRRRQKRDGVAALVTVVLFFGLGAGVEVFREPHLARQVEGVLVYPVMYLGVALIGAVLLKMRLRNPQGERTR